MLAEILQKCPNLNQVVEFINFDKFGLLSSESSSQNKDVKDLAEMRICQVFNEAIEELNAKVKLSQGKIILAASAET